MKRGVSGFRSEVSSLGRQIAAGYDTIAVFARPNGVQSGEKFCISFAVIFFTAKSTKNIRKGYKVCLCANAEARR